MAITYDLIQTTTLGSNQSQIQFTGISQAYTDLVLACRFANSAAGNQAILLRFNGDTGTNYSQTRAMATNGSIPSDRAGNQTFIDSAYLDGSGTGLGVHMLQIFQYTNTNVFKTVLTHWGTASAATPFVGMNGCAWRSTANITTITFSMSGGTNVLAGSSVSIYGIKAA